MRAATPPSPAQYLPSNPAIQAETEAAQAACPGPADLVSDRTDRSSFTPPYSTPRQPPSNQFHTENSKKMQMTAEITIRALEFIDFEDIFCRTRRVRRLWLV